MNFFNQLYNKLSRFVAFDYYLENFAILESIVVPALFYVIIIVLISLLSLHDFNCYRVYQIARSFVICNVLFSCLSSILLLMPFIGPLFIKFYNRMAIKKVISRLVNHIKSNHFTILSTKDNRNLVGFLSSSKFFRLLSLAIKSNKDGVLFTRKKISPVMAAFNKNINYDVYCIPELPRKIFISINGKIALSSSVANACSSTSSKPRLGKMGLHDLSIDLFSKKKDRLGNKTCTLDGSSNGAFTQVDYTYFRDGSDTRQGKQSSTMSITGVDVQRVFCRKFSSPDASIDNSISLRTCLGRSLLRLNIHTSFSLHHLKSIFKQILSQAHDNFQQTSCAHGDIKLENIVVSGDANRYSTTLIDKPLKNDIVLPQLPHTPGRCGLLPTHNIFSRIVDSHHNGGSSADLIVYRPLIEARCPRKYKNEKITLIYRTFPELQILGLFRYLDKADFFLPVFRNALYHDVWSILYMFAQLSYDFPALQYNAVCLMMSMFKDYCSIKLAVSEKTHAFDTKPLPGFTFAPKDSINIYPPASHDPDVESIIDQMNAMWPITGIYDRLFSVSASL